MTAPVRVKICGITSHADAMAAVDAGAELLGFNFYARSPRCVDVATVKDITRDLPESARTVGVFVDAPRDEVHSIAEEAGLQLLQFHGHESVDYCKDWPLPVIKALRVRDQQAAEDARRYDVEFILADAYVEGQLGGTGQRLAPELLAGFDKGRLILAGGLNPDNVAEAVRLVRPYAVDVASGVESSPGRKDAELMRRFVRNVQSA